MPVLITLVPEKENLTFPALVAAAMVLPTAKRLGCDRIRVERYNGVRVNEFSLDTVKRWVRESGLILQPRRRAREGQDYETRRPVWAGGVGG